MNKSRSNLLSKVLEGKKVTIVGHDNIDVDATLSGILMSKLLSFLRIENEFYILEEVKKNLSYQIITELFHINMKCWQNVVEDENRILFLVDHYKTTHKGNVIGCIDHHLTQEERNYEFMYVRNSCATAYMIYEIMKEVNYPFTKEVIKMVIVAMMVDTTSFKNTKTIPEEVTIAKKLAKLYNIDYKFLEKYCLCLTPISKMTIDEIISNGQKWYDYVGNKVGSSYLQLYGFPEDLVDEWLIALSMRLIETASDMLVFIIFDMRDNITIEYQIALNRLRAKSTSGILSRGKDIMPVIEKMYLNNVRGDWIWQQLMQFDLKNLKQLLK